jgi:pilus assembly protein CpaC
MTVSRAQLLPGVRVRVAGVCFAAAALCLVPGARAYQAPAAPAPAPPPPAPAAPAPQAGQATPVTEGAFQRIVILAGRSLVLPTDFDIKRIKITDTEVADAMPVSPRELVIDGKAPGTISLIVWGDTQRVQYELVVQPGVTTLQQRLQSLFPGEDINVGVSDGAVILSGHASSNDVMLRAAEIAEASTPDHKVINMLQLPGGSASKQVLLQVRFAEVNRTAVRELGLTLFSTRPGFTARSTTGQFSAPNFDDVTGQVGGLTFSDFLNIFFFNRTQGVGGLLKALQQHGNLQSLAEPNLIAYNGQEASFLAGGEFPVPFVAGSSGQVSVLFKEFGVRLKFKPTIAGDVIRLHVRPEVSTLDFDNGVTISGFRIPALSERYAETDVELRDGQSFAIAGLLNNIVQANGANIPFLSQIPIIGKIFQSDSQHRDQTELMVLITPRLVRALNPDEVPPLPTNIKDFGNAPGAPSKSGSGGGMVDAPVSKENTSKPSPGRRVP